MCTYYSYKNLQINPFDLIGINVKHNFFFSPELMQREKPRYALSLSLSQSILAFFTMKLFKHIPTKKIPS